MSPRRQFRLTGILVSVFMWIITLSLMAQNLHQPLVMLFLFLWAGGLFVSGLCVGDALRPITWREVAEEIRDRARGVQPYVPELTGKKLRDFITPELEPCDVVVVVWDRDGSGRGWTYPCEVAFQKWDQHIYIIPGKRNDQGILELAEGRRTERRKEQQTDG